MKALLSVLKEDESLYRTGLERRGYRVHHVPSLQAAYKAARERNYDLVSLGGNEFSRKEALELFPLWIARHNGQEAA